MALPNPFGPNKVEVVSDVAATEREIEAYLGKLTSQSSIEPEAHLPFAVDKAKAVEAFHKWIKSLTMAPGMLKKTADLSSIKAVYLPYWHVNSMSYCDYKGERGDNYTEKEHYTDAQGNSQTRNVTKTRWNPVSGQVRNHFEAVFVSGSSSLPDKHAEHLKPKDFKKLQPGVPGSGEHTVEKYSLDPRSGFNKARAVMDNHLTEQIKKDIGGNQQKVGKKDIRHVGVAIRHVLAPGYLATYKFRGKDYNVAINGATGEVTGDYPVSAAKVAGLILIILLVVAAIGAAIYFFVIAPAQNKPNPPPGTEGSLNVPAKVATLTGCSSLPALPPPPAWGAETQLADLEPANA
jgi:hypothetical protein